MIPTESHPLLVFNGFGYTDFDICRNGLLFIRDVTKGINVINPHGEDPCVYAPGDWVRIDEISNQRKWVPWGQPTSDKFPQQRSFIRLADDPAETFIDPEAREVYTAVRGADLTLFFVAAVVFLGAIFLTINFI